MTRLQKSKVNTTSQVIPTMAKLRRYLEGDVFMIPQRPRSYKDVRNGEYPMVPLARADLPDWAKKCVKILVEQIDARFLKRGMSKWIYIATVMDPRNVLTKCFRDGDAVSVADATKMYRTELKDIARRHDVTRLKKPVVKPVVKPPAVKPPASGGSGKAKMRRQLKTALNFSSSDGSSGDDITLGDQLREEIERVDVRSALDKEVDALEKLRKEDGSKYRRDPAFTLIKFYDLKRATFYLHRRLDTVVQSAKVDEASCERDFSLSGRVFTPLLEHMDTGVGEQMVSIPLIAKTIPVTCR